MTNALPTFDMLRLRVEFKFVDDFIDRQFCKSVRQVVVY